MQNINNNKSTAKIPNLFQKTSHILHSFNTRSSTSGEFFITSCRLEIKKQFSLLARSKVLEYYKVCLQKSFPQIAI